MSEPFIVHVDAQRGGKRVSAWYVQPGETTEAGPPPPTSGPGELAPGDSRDLTTAILAGLDPPPVAETRLTRFRKGWEGVTPDEIPWPPQEPRPWADY